LTGPLTVSAVWLLGAFTPLSLFSMASIVADEDVFLQFKEESKKQYSRIWSQFRDFVPEHDFELASNSTQGFGHNFVILSLNMTLSWLPLLRIPSPCFSTF